MKLILQEIKRLEQDYCNCDISDIKKLIRCDITFLSKAIVLTENRI